jgi:hypothetical protein
MRLSVAVSISTLARMVQLQGRIAMQLTAEVRPTAFKARPFKVVFKHADVIVGEWPVTSVKAAEERIAETLCAMNWKEPQSGCWHRSA